MNCENIQNYSNEILIPDMYKTYFYEHEELNNPPSIEEFLDKYGLSKKGC